MDNQQGPTVQHMELCSVLGGSLDGRGVLGRTDTFICMAESHHCSPETVTSMLISYTPIQNKTLKIKIKCTDTIQCCEKSRDAYNPQRACVLSHSVISNSLQPNCPYPQAPLFTEFSSYEYWSRLPFLLPGISPTHGLNNVCLLYLLHWQADSLPLYHLGNPYNPYKTIIYIHIF